MTTPLWVDDCGVFRISHKKVGDVQESPEDAFAVGDVAVATVGRSGGDQGHEGAGRSGHAPDRSDKGEGDLRYGRWEACIPGPRQHAPWITDAEWEGASDSLAAGGIYMTQDKKGPRLLTMLQEG
ncbi:hypothetical protein ACSBPQ_01495 [Stenotrophomonas sp. JC08]|uniref:hypothetical protein n=1 Tax=Stenotrophomonas sp. JC08 TaxID=3445779 RepID=UPI003FA1D61D